METNNRRRRSMVFRLFALVLLLLGSHGAWAASTCSGGGQAYTITMPASINVPRDAVPGTVLTSYSYSSSVPNIWTCNTSGATYTGSGFKGNNSIVATYTIGGQSVPVHSTSIPGIGIAFYIDEYTNGCGWGPSTELQNPTNGYGWGACNQNGNGLANGLQIGVSLIRLPGAVTAGLLNPGIVGYGAAYNNGVIPSPGTSQVSYAITPVQINVLACTTPDVFVPLGTHASSEMASVGAGTTPVSFVISLNGCPAGLGTGVGGLNTASPAIQYRIDPVTTVINSSQSVVALDSSSSASGVGVQLLNSAGTAAFPLSSYQTLAGYNPSTGGSYTIPLKARYYRTGTISAGSANTSMTFTMQYQ